jgi:protoporphyrinogen oxidase
VTFFSNYSPRNAPDGHVSYMAEVTFRDREDRSTTRSSTISLKRSRNRSSSAALDLVQPSRTSRSFAYIDQNLEFADRIARVRKWFDESGLVTVGRFGRYEYHNSDQCIARAFEVHEQMRSYAETGNLKPLELS